MLTRPKKAETAVHCCDPALSVLVVLVSRNVFRVVSALQSICSKPEPAIWSCDIGQRFSYYDSCQLNITCMSNIKDICCNPGLHDLVIAGWPPCMLCDVVVVRRRSSSLGARARDPCRHDHKKRVAWVPVSMHTCGPVYIILELRFVALRAARVPPL